MQVMLLLSHTTWIKMNLLIKIVVNVVFTIVNCPDVSILLATTSPHTCPLVYNVGPYSVIVCCFIVSAHKQLSGN